MTRNGVRHPNAASPPTVGVFLSFNVNVAGVAGIGDTVGIRVKPDPENGAYMFRLEQIYRSFSKTGNVRKVECISSWIIFRIFCGLLEIFRCVSQSGSPPRDIPHRNISPASRYFPVDIPKDFRTVN